MDVSFVCPDCQSKLKFDAASYPAGTEIDCPNCSSNISIPRPNIGPGVTIGGFELKKLLGKGGMGEVYLATQLSMHRDVALKILPGHFALQEGAVDRFLQEVKMAARLKHPNIVRAYEAGEDHGVYFLAMDFVEGTAIDERLRKGGAMPEAEVRIIAEKLGRALDQIWEKHKMIHRDIKPANIMLDEYGEPLLMDMGLSKALDDGDGLTMSTAIMGSPNYMSPEQAEGAAHLDFRTDMYSLGATFYHMLTGKVPFKGKSVMEVLRKQATEQLVDPREHNPDIGEGMVCIIERMMAKKAEHRYPTWHDFLRAMESLVFGSAPEETGLKPGDSVMMRGTDSRAATPAQEPEVAETPPVERAAPIPEPEEYSAEQPEPAVDSSVDAKSKTPLFIGIGSVVAVLVLVGIFVASRPGEDEASSPTTAGVTPSGMSATEILTSPEWQWTEPVNLTVLNTKDAETQPCLSGDGLTLIFASDRPGGAGKLDLWQTTRSSIDEAFGPPVPFDAPVNTKHIDNGPWISADGQTLLFSSDRPGGKGGGDIWQATRNSRESRWANIVHLSSVSSTTQELGPSLSPDGQELLFEQWSEANHFQIRLARRNDLQAAFAGFLDPGTGINSRGRDGGPEFVADGRSFVYQSGPANGKDDLFVSLRSENGSSFQPGIRFGAPLNTVAVEAHPTLSADGRTIVFCSDREGSLGKLDLWMSRRVPRQGMAAASAGVGEAKVELERGLVGHWNFEGGSANRVEDSSGNGYSGNPLGRPDRPARIDDAPPVSRAGKSSMVFRRQAQRVDVPATGNQGITKALTMAGWVKLGVDAGRTRNIISRRENFGFRMTVTGLIAMGFGENRFREFKPKGSTRFPLNQWYHLAGVYDGEFVHLYIDGVLERKTPHTAQVPVLTQDIVLGRMGGKQTPVEMETLIDDIRLYDRALSVAEVRALAGK